MAARVAAIHVLRAASKAAAGRHMDGQDGEDVIADNPNCRAAVPAGALIVIPAPA
jgi:hypothetical protein